MMKNLKVKLRIPIHSLIYLFNPHLSSLNPVLPFFQHFSVSEKKERKGDREGEKMERMKKGKSQDIVREGLEKSDQC